MSNNKRSVDLEGFAPAAANPAIAATVPAANPADEVSSSTNAAATSDKLKGGHSHSSNNNNNSIEAKKKPTAARKETAKKLAAMFLSSAASAAASSHENNQDSDTAAASAVAPFSSIGPNFKPCTLPEIQSRLKALMDALPKDDDIPSVPPDINDSSNEDSDDTIRTQQHLPIKSFASQLQQIIEQYNLLLSLVSSATYKWGVDRSGASQQNLSVMVAELQQCQEMISSTVSSRLSNVLCPAVDVLVGEVEIVREQNCLGDGGGDKADDGNENETNGCKKRKLNNHITTSNNNPTTSKERRINHYIRAQVDPSYVHLSHVILARNATMIRHTVATSIYTAHTVISDYLKAMQKDMGGHNAFNM